MCGTVLKLLLAPLRVPAQLLRYGRRSMHDTLTAIRELVEECNDLLPATLDELGRGWSMRPVVFEAPVEGMDQLIDQQHASTSGCRTRVPIHEILIGIDGVATVQILVPPAVAVLAIGCRPATPWANDRLCAAPLSSGTHDDGRTLGTGHAVAGD